MRDRLDGLVSEFEDLGSRLGDPDLLADQSRYTVATRRYKDLETIVGRWHQVIALEDDLAAAEELMDESDADERESFRAEIESAKHRIDELLAEIRILLLPKDENEGRNVIVEIRGAEGGEEANLFAKDLFNMYEAFAGSKGWSFEVLETQPSPMGGLNEVIFRVAGEGVWNFLKFEAGVHRVQRVPVTEAQGRIHTSSATVVVLPEAEEVDVEIDPNDIEIDVYRSSGAGGQHVNTTDSAVRITHKPTGIVVTSQDQRSQMQNRARAMAVLRSRLLKHHQDASAAEQSGAKRAQIGGGGRSEKIRTYNFKENRVSDHRHPDLTLYKLDRILGNGELDEIVETLLHEERARMLAEGDT